MAASFQSSLRTLCNRGDGVKHCSRKRTCRRPEHCTSRVNLLSFKHMYCSLRARPRLGSGTRGYQTWPSQAHSCFVFRTWKLKGQGHRWLSKSVLTREAFYPCGCIIVFTYVFGYFICANKQQYILSYCYFWRLFNRPIFFPRDYSR